MGEIAFHGKLSDNPDLAKGLEALLKFVTKNPGLAGGYIADGGPRAFSRR